MRTVAIIHRDAGSAAALKSLLDAAGFRADAFTGSAAALAAMRRRPYAVVLLDLSIADADPLELCALARESQPVICMTCDPSDEQCLRAFEAGADDYVRRPMALRELVARIRNVMRRVPGTDSAAPLMIGDVQLFLDAMRVRIDDRTIDLTRGEAEVLTLLVEAAPSALTVTQMMQMLPDAAAVKRGTVESRIKSLRRKIGRGLIVSRGAFGYQLVGMEKPDAFRRPA